MGDGTEPRVYHDDDQQLDNNNQQGDKIKGSSFDPFDTDQLIATGKIDNGTEFGNKFVIIQHTSQKGKPYFRLYQSVGFVNKSKEESKTDWSGEIMIDTRKEEDIEKDKCKMFGYNGQTKTGKFVINWDIVQTDFNEYNQVTEFEEKAKNEFDDDIPF